ncbi:uncharacterized protein LOC133188001 [Saccostrea echinata]|uniref:uncharacterized protein LOC133188001 n=1 Tax=Saccostrea echinata TaxID=191078 RepID=UPI002A803D9A|nr:uncharacterized protein LOC133188001 [Saccostrea echinata]
MVQKKERCGLRTGHTIRKHFLSQITHDGYIDYKFINTPSHFEPEEFKKLFNRKDVVLTDGRDSFSPLTEGTDGEFNDIHINIKHREGEYVTYSLDKQKRWTLPSLVKNNIDSLAEEDFRVVVSERKTFTAICTPKGPYYGLDTKYRTWNDCVQYIDSKTPLPIATPNKSASFFCDLRRKCLGGGRVEQKTQSRKRKRHNMHSRGVQRKSELQQKTEKVNNEQEYNRYQLLDGADSKDMAEFRYEICLPQGMKSRYNCTKAELYDRAVDKLPHYSRQVEKKSLSKLKGMVNGFRSVWKKLQLKERLEENDDFIGYSSTSHKGSLSECRTCEEEIDYSDEVVYAYDAYDEDACCVPKKNNIEVDIFDCLKKERRKQKTGNQQKRRKRTFSDEDLDEKSHIVYLNEDKIEEKDEISSAANPLEDSSDVLQEILPHNVECFFRRTEMEDFLRKTPSFYSTSSHPTIFVIPLQISLREDENKSVSFDGEDPALVLQEKISSAVSASEEGIAECRLRIVGSEELYSTEKVNRDLNDFLTSQEEFLILSLGEIIHFAKDIVQQNTSHTSLKKLGQHEPCALEPVFDWLPRVTYNVATIKQASLQNCDLLGEVQKTLPPHPNSLSGIADSECGVCFVPLCDTKMNSCGSNPIDGVLILPCQHYFCRTCLLQYVLEKVRTGARSLSCLEYQCESTLDPIFIMSLVPSHIFGQWSSRQQEQAVMSTGLWKWCPNKICNLIVSLSKKDQRVKERGILVKDHMKMKGVTCLCHTEFCMECEELPHWPASCQQIGEYVKALNIQKDLLNEEDYVRTFRVNVKPCPSCKEKVDKNGGCNAMTCRCGHHFCWLCLKGNPYGVHTCKEVPLQEVELVNSKVVKFQTRYLTKAYSYRVQSSKLIRWRNILLQKVRKDIPKLPWNKNTHIGLDQLQGKMSLKSLQLQYLNVLIESVKLSEKVLVSVANLSRKSEVGKQLMSLANMVDFIISRMSELLHDLHDAKVCSRIERLNTILSENIKKMVLLSLFMQQTRLKQRTLNISLNIRYSVGYD